MNKHMQRQLQQQLKAEQHPLNQEALEILRVLQALAEDPEGIDEKDPEELQDPVLWTPLPILDLMGWREAPSTMYGMEHYNRELMQLEEMAREDDPNKVMHLIAGPQEDRGMGSVDLWELQKGSWKDQEEIKRGLRSSLKNLLADAQHEMNLRRKKHNWLMELSTLTPEQAELLSDVVDTAVEDELNILLQKDTLDDFEQEVFAALHTYPNALTTGQAELLSVMVGIAVEDELVRLTQKDTLTDSEQELFEALQVLQSEGALESEPAALAEASPEPIAESESTATPELEADTQPETVTVPESVPIANDYVSPLHESTVLTAQLHPDVSEVGLNLSEDVRGVLSTAQALVVKMMKRSGKMFYRFVRDGTLYRLGFLSGNGTGDGKTESAAFTPEQAELLLDRVQFIIENEIERLTVKEALDEFEQEFLVVLQADKEDLKAEQAELSEKTIAVIIENEIERLTAKETLTDREQVLLETLQANISPESTPETEITQETGTDPKPTEVPDTSSVQEKAAHYSEDQVKDIVAHYFESLPIASPGYSVKREYLIQMGSDQRRADIVFLRNGKLVAIAECKRTRRIEKGNEQLHSYLCATDTFLGIFANNSDPNKWTFWENHRHNNFLEIDRETFENYVYNHDKAIKDREKAIVNSVKSQIA